MVNTLLRRTALTVALIVSLSIYANAATDTTTVPRALPAWSLKNNLLYDATLTPNLGLELRTGQKTSVQLFYGLNPWDGYHGKKRLKHWSLMPEWRRWLQAVGPMQGWFWGLHAVGGEMNVGGVKLPCGLFKPLRHNRYEGWYAGGGLTAGYAWRLADEWRLEAALGVGYLHVAYDEYLNGPCGRPLGSGHYNYVGPTKLALNVAYVFGRSAEQPQTVTVVEQVPVVVPQSYRPDYRLDFVTPQAEARKARNLSGRAYLDFPVNRTDIRPDYRRNADELRKVTETIDQVRQDPNTTITHIAIHGYASPEGSYQNNARLAEGRAQAFRDYVASLVSLPADAYTVASTPEDWQGLQQAINNKVEYAPVADILADKQTAIHHPQSTQSTTLDLLERQLRSQHPQLWKRLVADVFPALRHSDYEVSYTVRPFSVEEARQVLADKPEQLSLSEMFLVAQTYEPGSQAYNDVFQTAVSLYPDDPTANLNAAVAALKRGDTAEAARHLQRAGSSPEALLAQGVMYALQGDTVRAAELWRQSGLPTARHNLSELQRATRQP